MTSTMTPRVGLWVEIEAGYVIQDRNGDPWTVVSLTNRLAELKSETGARLTLNIGAYPLGTVTILVADTPEGVTRP